MIRDGKVLFDNHTADSYDKRKRMITHKERDDGYRIVNCPKLISIAIGSIVSHSWMLRTEIN